MIFVIACRPFACRVAMLTTAMVVAAPFGAIAQPFVCWPVAPGDTVSGLARRLTGDAAAAYSDLFQIRDPAHQVFVPKSQYRRLRADWQVCVARKTVLRPVSPSLATAPISPLAVRALRRDVAEPRSRLLARDDVYGALRVGIAVALLLFTCTGAVRFVRPSAAPPDLQRAGEQFVSAFARPLIDPGSSVPPILMRLHFVRRSEELEIYLAPSGGRRYPNLLDHKRNVEYDIHRVLRLLGPRVVVSRPVRAENKWVVVPIRLVDQKQAGV